MNELLENIYLGNSLKNWATAVVMTASFCLALKIFSKVFLKKFKLWARRTNTSIDDYVGEVIERIILPFAYIVAVYIGLSNLDFNSRTDKILKLAFGVVSAFFAARMIVSIIRRSIMRFIDSQEAPQAKKKQSAGILLLVNILVYALAFLFLIDNLGYDVSTIIAGLGIGGIAIALAAQTILGDLFSYFVIFFDKPFEIGDFIKIGEDMGSIEHIGIKTTRIRTLSGEQMICSNTSLTNSRVFNFRRMEKRRVAQKIGVVYQTKLVILKQVPDIIKSVIETQPDVLFDRVHLSGFGDFSLDIEFVYYINSPDYLIYMDRLQRINFLIIEEFEKLAIEFAYPTHTIYAHSIAEQAVTS